MMTDAVKYMTSRDELLRQQNRPRYEQSEKREVAPHSNFANPKEEESD